MIHRSRQRQGRITRKKQRGGVSLVGWPDVGARLAEWKAALQIPALENMFAPKTDVKADYLERWFRVLEHQDELFDTALQLMSRAANVDSEEKILATDPATIEGRRSELVAYLTDVEKMVNFNIDTGKSGVTKLIQIATNKSEPLLSLFLFPNRVHNMFIESLATLFAALKPDTEMLAHIRNPFLAKVVAAQYRAYVLSNTMTTTGMIQRDGYYLDYPCTKIKNDFVANISDEFYVRMLEEIADGRDLPYDKLFSSEEGCVYYIDNWEWEKIAAHVFLAYKTGDLSQVLTRFGTECSPQPPKRDVLETKYYPDEYMDVTVRGVRFGTLLSNMSYLQLEFILQLCYKLTSMPAS